MSSVRAPVFLTVAVCAVPLVGLAFVAGPVPARTGGFGEMTCRECHWENPLNESRGGLTLSGIPTRYTPGARYLITVDLVHPQLVLGGFQLAARFDGGSSAGNNAGDFGPTDALTQRVPDEAGRIIYIQHTEAGAAAAGSGAAHWTLEWIAPPESAPVVFHAAGNAANGDASPLGDFIYTTTARSEAAPARAR